MLCAPSTMWQTPRVRKPQHMDQRQKSDLDSPYLIQTDRIARAIIQLGRARRLMIGDLLRVLDCTIVLPVRGNALQTGRAQQFPM